MSNSVSDTKIRIIIYTATIVGFAIAAFYKPVLNSIYLSNAEKCYAQEKYICAFNNYKGAFNTGINDEQYEEHYFQTLKKMKKNAIIQGELNKLLETYPDNDISYNIKELFRNLQEKILAKYGDTYIINTVEGSNVIHWNNLDGAINVYIENGKVPEYYVPEIKSAFMDFQRVTGGKLNFNYVNGEKEADIVIKFTDDVSGGKCDEANCAKVLGLTENITSGGMLKKSFIKLREKDVDNSDFTRNQIYNISKHEIGHAMGISGHSFVKNDVMYPTNTDTKWAEDSQTLLISRKSFSSRDINTLKLLYDIIPDVTNKSYNVDKNPDMYFPVAVLGTRDIISQNKVEEAMFYADKVTNNFVAQMALADSYFSNKRYQQAQEAYDAALFMAQTNEEKAAVYHNLAVVAFGNNDYKTAISYADLSNANTNDMIHKSSDEIKAYSLMELGNYEAAQKILENFVSNNPENVVASSSLVTTYFKQLNIPKALGEIKRIKQINPNAMQEPVYRQYSIIGNFL